MSRDNRPYEIAYPHESAHLGAWMVHNLVAHPLLVLCPPLGNWLHELTARRMG